MQRFSFPRGASPHPKHWVPHHAAAFGPTRWTNLYFPNSYLVVGDLIGGPLQTVFGHGVRDVPVTTTQRHGWLSHTLYWRIPAMADSSNADHAVPSTAVPSHIIALREAVDLMDDHHIPEPKQKADSAPVVESV